MSFLISPYNSLRFAKRDTLLPNYDNQLHCERVQSGLLILPYSQLVNKDDEITIQIRTDYDGAITAVLRDNSDYSTTPITVTEKKTYPLVSTWEFTKIFDTIGDFSIIVTGADSEQDSVEYESEPIDVALSHDSLLIKYYNTTNTEFVDYSTGIQHMLRVESRIPDGAEETDQDIYDNQNKKQKTYAATTFNGELATVEIPEYLKRQIVLAGNLFFFLVNNKQYTVMSVTPERFGESTSQTLTLVCSEVDTPGVNSDDSGQSVTPEDMTQNTYPLNLVDVAGPQEITVVADFMPEIIMFRLRSGAEAEIKAGTSIGGTEITSPKTVNTAKPVYTLGREYLKTAAQYGSSFKIYFTITGVGAKVDINTIITKYK
jgi:hypothetical protein